MVQKKLLRVLYTVNGSPQYILARSYSQVQVTLIPPTSTNHSAAGSSSGVQELNPIYASVSLKTCLDTICRSSPELTHDTTRDFSLYVLDPLESSIAPAPVQINNSNKEKCQLKNAAVAAEPRGVAVGLGLMSWALATDESDSAPVVGTLVKQPNGQDALEVIFALRETTAMKRPAWSLPPSSSQPSSSQASTSNHVLEPSSSQSEVKPLLAHQLASERSDQITRETLASIQLRNKAKVKPPPKPAKTSTVPTTESDKLLNADVNIGPTRKKGRRPKTAAPPPNSASFGTGQAGPSGSFPQDAIVIDGSDSDSAPASSSYALPRSSITGVRDLTRSHSASTASIAPPPILPPPAPSIIAPTPTSQVKSEPQEISVTDILNYLSATSTSEPNPQNAAILAALMTIDAKASDSQQGTSQQGANQEAPPNPALVSALKQLISLIQQPQSNPPPPQTPHVNHARPLQPPSSQQKVDGQLNSAPSANPEPIAVDKENVNPKPKQTNEKELKTIKPSPSSPAMPSTASNPSTSRRSSHTDRPLQSVTFGAKTNEASSSKIAPTPAPSSSASNENSLTRKRTLSDFMDEKEYQRSKGKGKERERSDRRDKASSSASRTKPNPADSLRHYPMILASAQPRSEQPSNYYRTALESMTMTSPGRPPPRSEIIAQPSTSFALPLPTSFRSQTSSKLLLSPSRRISASSPVRKEPRRKYVVPEWAKTTTSTQPRLSEEARRAMEEADKAKKMERLAARKKLPSNMNRNKNQSAPPSRSHSVTSSADEGNSQPTASTSTAGPILAAGGPVISHERPLFAAPDITFPFMSTRSSSPPPRPAAIPKTPKTPVRSRTGATPGGEDDSLFTPIGRSGSLFGSARSYTQQTPSVLTSPLGNRKKAKISPARSLLTGLSFPSSSNWSKTSSSVHGSEDSKTVKGSEGSRLSPDCQLDGTVEELEAPPSSLPIASSDIDIDENHAEEHLEPCVATPNTDGENDGVPVKQHWQGLPPSSPPAPSSPMLLPESTDDDEEMEDIPIATSDSETDAEMTPVDSPAYFDDELAQSMSAADLSAFFPDLLPPQSTCTTTTSTLGGGLTDDGSSSSGVDIFQQFANVSSDADFFAAAMAPGSQASDQTEIDAGFEAMFQGGLDGIDFTEFWETFKPLIDSSTQGGQMGEGGQFNGMQDGSSPTNGVDSSVAVDHVKLADDVQALLSGCLM